MNGSLPIPSGFWSTMAFIGMLICLVFSIDLLLGAKLMRFLGLVVNRKYHVDQNISHALQELEKASDREYDLDATLLSGWGRVVMSGLLFVGAIMLLINVIPKVK